MDNHIAIHKREGSYSDRWISYCDAHALRYRIVDCFAPDIVEQLKSSDALLWHWHSERPEDVILARNLIYVAETMGLVVFPNTATCWCYDNKIAQKYILEALGLPLVPTVVLYDLDSAMEWIASASFPKVFKLSKGASSQNVKLVGGPAEAERLARKAFARGFRAVGSYFQDASAKISRTRKRGNAWTVLKRAPAVLMRNRRANRLMGREKGYVYFQDFVPDNTHDTRVTVIGRRAFGFTRGVRRNDFRASGSGLIDYDPKAIDPACVRLAFDVARALRTQSVACDFIQTPSGDIVITEVSYCYMAEAVHNCSGHWDEDLAWHAGSTWPEDAILVDLLDGHAQSKQRARP